MATSSIPTKSSVSHCDEQTNPCRGCSEESCFDHLTQHRQYLKEQFTLIQDEFHQFRQNLIDTKNNAHKHPLIQQIDQWENESMDKIKQKANECRQLVDHYVKKSISEIEMKLKKTNEQMNLNEIHLNELKQKFEELKKAQHLLIQHEPNPFILEISIQVISPNQTWKQFATTVAGGYGKGKGSNQLSDSYGMSIDDDQTILIADTNNYRIVEWKKNSNHSQIVAGGNGRGDANNQLDGPTSVIIDRQTDSLIICDYGNRRVVRWPRRNGQTGEILISNIDCANLQMDNDGYLYVSDREKHEVRRWKIGEENGTLVAGGNGQGNRLNQLDTPLNIFIDADHSVYVSDTNNHRVMKWMKGAKEGIIVAGGQGQGNGLNQLSSPLGIIVDQLGSVYVADLENARVMRWLKGANEGTIVVGGNGSGQEPNQLNGPVYLSFDRANNLHVLDGWNHRVQRFDVN